MVKRIAQLSDLHLLSFDNRSVTAGQSLRTRYVSLGRSLDPEARAGRARTALARARSAGADHVVLTGDLTELGLLSEIEVLAEVLWSSGFAPDAITFIPGNHDRYAGTDEWQRGLEGPLRPWARYSPPNGCVDLGTLRLLPLDVTRPQSVLRSAGFVTSGVTDALHRFLKDPLILASPVAVLVHHAPFSLAPVLHAIDGLMGWEHLTLATRSLEQVQLVHGHTHRAADHGSGALPKILGAGAIVESADWLRIYDVTADGLAPVSSAESAVGDAA